MVSGELRAAFSLSEPELGSDVAATKTSATRQGDGSWEITGRKMWVTNGCDPRSCSCLCARTRTRSRDIAA
jgi:alkylation response protein AidB-like acyl-CoA dehydrogenase